MITLKLLLWLAYIAVDAWINYTIIEVNDKRPNYLVLNIQRGIAFILYGVFIFDTQADLRTFYIFLYCTTSFWLLFDLGINIARKKHPLYIGMHSGWIDRFGFQHKAIYYIGKVCALAALIFSIVKIYQG